MGPDPRAGWGRRLLLSVVLLLHVAVAVGYWRVTPLFDRPDEPAHFNNVRHLAERGSLDVMTGEAWQPGRLEALKRNHFLDVQGPLDPVLEGIRYQAWQPPLYYAAAAAVWRLTGSMAGLRALSLLFSCAALALTVRIVLLVYPDQSRLAWAAGLFLALHPMRAYLATAVNNDPAAECLLALGFWMLLSGKPAWMIGAAAGAGLLTKVHLGLLLPLTVLWIATDPDRGENVRARWNDPRNRRDLLAVVTLCLLVAAPWMLRNLRLYGWTDPLALQAGALGSAEAELAAFGRTRPTLAWAGPHGAAAFFRILLVSWWGVYGWMSMWPPRFVQWGYVGLTLLPLAGLVCRVFRGPPDDPPPPAALHAARWIGVTPLFLLVALLLYALSDFQPQGRYLLVAGTSWGLLFALGWNALPPLLRWPAAAGALCGLAVINGLAVGSVIPWYLNQVSP